MIWALNLFAAAFAVVGIVASCSLVKNGSPLGYFLLALNIAFLVANLMFVGYYALRALGAA